MSMRSVLITGCSTGIGKACALHLAAAGFRVFAGVRQKEAGRALVLEANGGSIVPILLDVTQPRDIEAAADVVRTKVGQTGLDGLVNNAGVGVSGPLEIIDMEELRWHFDVNVFGVVAVTQAFTELLRAKPGRIVNISSIAGRISGPFWSACTASKHALEAITDSMRQELLPWGISVSAVQTAPIDTSVWRKEEAHRERRAAALSERARELYGRAIECRAKMDTSIANASEPPEIVARVVERALTEPHPKSRYPAGKGARAALFARWLMSDRFLDSMMLNRLGLTQTHLKK